METGFTPLSLMLNDWAPKPAGADVAIAQLLLDAAGPRRAGRLLNGRTSIMARTALHIAVAMSLHETRAAQKEAVIELLLDQPELDVNAADALGARAGALPRECGPRREVSCQRVQGGQCVQATRR